MRVLLVANPRATATTPRERAVLEHALGSIASLDVQETANRGHAAALACRAMRDGVDAVIAFGGDGTVNEVVNGLLTDGVHEAVPALGVVPAGSTNVVARALGLPNDAIEATGALLDALEHKRTRRIGLGRADGRYFTFAVGIGFDAAIVRGVEAARAKGRHPGNLLYARVGVREFLRADRRHPALHIERPGADAVDGLHYVIATNTDPWTFVGGRAVRPTPEASFDTGLDVYARTRMGAVGLLASMARMSLPTPRTRGPGSWRAHDLAHFVVWADEPIPVQIDGDLVGERDRIALSAVPDALDVLV